MAITNARIQVRRGLEKDFNPDEMTPGEWALSTDTKYIRMCIYPGLCLRMATYEAFEEDMKQIQSIVSEARTIQEAINRINTEVSSNAQAVAEYTAQAKQYRDEAKQFRDEASALANVGIATETVPGLMAGGDNAVAEDGTLMLTKTTTDRTLLKSNAGGLKVNRMDGESRQKQYSGKNLLKNTATSQTINGVTFTVNNEDRTVTVKGTATADTYYRVAVNEFIPNVNTEYIFTAGIAYNDNYIAYIENVDGNAAWVLHGQKIKPTTTTPISCLIYIKNGATVNNLIYAPMIRLASITDSTYEPYVGGTASPNPSYKQDIKSVKVGAIKGTGKNLWTFGDETTNVMTYKTINIPAGTYTFSALVTSSDTDDVTSLIECKYVGGGEKYVYLNRNTRASSTVTFTKDVNVLYFYPSTSWAFSQNDTATFKDIQIEEGSTMTEFESHREKSIQLSKPITLGKKDGVKEVFCKQDGVYGILRKFAKKILNGSETYSLLSAGNNSTKKYFGCWSLGEKAYYPVEKHCFLGYCTHLVPIDYFTMYWDAPVNRIALMSNAFFISLDGVTTVDALKTWLSTHNIEFMYELETPVFEPLPLADQIALHQLETFDTVTYISTDSEIEPVMEVEYGTSKVGAYALEAMLGKEANKLRYEQLNTLVSALATQLV